MKEEDKDCDNLADLFIVEDNVNESKSIKEDDWFIEDDNSDESKSINEDDWFIDDDKDSSMSLYEVDNESV